MPKSLTTAPFGAYADVTLPVPTRMLPLGKTATESPPKVGAAPFEPKVESSCPFASKRATMRRPPPSFCPVETRIRRGCRENFPVGLNGNGKCRSSIAASDHDFTAGPEPRIESAIGVVTQQTGLLRILSG